MDVSVEILKLTMLETGRYEVSLSLDGITKSSTIYVEANVQLANLPKFQLTVPEVEPSATGDRHRALRVKVTLNDRNTSNAVLYGEGEALFCMPSSASNPYYPSPNSVRSSLGKINKVVSNPCKVVQVVLTVPSLNVLSLKKYKGRVWVKFETPFQTPPPIPRPDRMIDDEVSIEDTPLLQWQGSLPHSVPRPMTDESLSRPASQFSNAITSATQSTTGMPQMPESTSHQQLHMQMSPEPLTSYRRVQQDAPLTLPHSISSQLDPQPSNVTMQSMVQPNSSSQSDFIPRLRTPVLTSTLQAGAVDLQSVDHRASTGLHSPSASTSYSTQLDDRPPTVLSLSRTSVTLLPEPAQTTFPDVRDFVSCAVQTDEPWTSRSTGVGVEEQLGVSSIGNAATDSILRSSRSVLLEPAAFPSLRTVVTSLLNQDRLDQSRMLEHQGTQSAHTQEVMPAPPVADPNEDVLRTLAAELRDYKIANAKLSEEIGLMKSEADELNKEVVLYKKMAAPVVSDDFALNSEPEVIDQLRSLTKGDLYLKALEFHSHCQGLVKQITAYRDKVTALQNSLILRNDRESEFLHLQKAHTSQQQMLLNLQNKVEKLNRFEQTCKVQEKVIRKLETVVSSRPNTLEGDANAYKVLVDENRRLRDRIKSFELHMTGHQPLPSSVRTSSSHGSQYLSCIDKLTAQCDSLEVKLGQLDHTRNSQSHLLELERKLIVATTELEVVKDQLQSNISSMAEERAHHIASISELQGQLKHLHQQQQHSYQ